MTSLIGTTSRRLALDTARGNNIENEQFIEICYQDLSRNEELIRRYGNDIVQRSPLSPIYNCHGLTFASRRTGLFDTAVLERILEEDSYELVPVANVLPGDVVLYYSEDGDIEHSGVVVEPPSPANFFVPRIYSKWGRYLEVIHLANKGPYNFSRPRYYRVDHGEYKHA